MSRLSNPDDSMMRKQQAADLGRRKKGDEPLSDRSSEEAGRIEDSVRGNEGESQSREDRGLDGSETEQAMRRAVERDRKRQASSRH